MLVISKKQIAQLKVHAEANYKRMLCIKKAKKHNADNKISEDLFGKRILMNYDTARYYGFTTKREVEIFIDYTFLHEDLNKPSPLDKDINRMLGTRDKTPVQKFQMLKEYFANENKTKR